MAKIRSNVTKKVKAAVLTATKLVETSAKLRVQGGSKSGATTQKYQPRRTHTASAPGESPATDQGELVQSINGFIDVGGTSGGVEATAAHAEPLELGSVHDNHVVEARPFLQPALEENKIVIKRLLETAVKKAI